MNVPMTRLNPVQIAILMVATFTLAMLVMSPETQVTSVPYNPLDGCVYVYLDMGTNVGVQIRNGNPCKKKCFLFMLSFSGNFLNHKNFQAQLSLKYLANSSSRTQASLEIWRSFKTRQDI